jgi:hypothetical protein
MHHFIGLMKHTSHDTIFRNWFNISIFNLLLVSTLGMLMRYKIAFSLSFVNQRNLLNAHSHFAFAGWITQALMLYIAVYISKHQQAFSIKKYNYLLSGNLLSAYGMLVSFPFEGYAFTSIVFSTLSLFVSYAFAIIVWRDLNRIGFKSISHSWIRAALLFNVLSSLGPYTLAYMMATKHIYQNLYLVSIYFFLHFQYNGWFFFACMGLLTAGIPRHIISYKVQRNIFYLFLTACVPAFFLSALWLHIPGWLYVLVVMAAFAQVLGWCICLIRLIRHRTEFFHGSKRASRILLFLSAMALSIKLLLQLGSTIPSLSTWAFGFRPIIIAYLHLVFLGIISLFILGYALWHGFLSLHRSIINATWIFVFGIVLNEIFLLAQGLGAINYMAVPYVTECLLAAACIMFLGLAQLNVAIYKKQQPAIT